MSSFNNILTDSSELRKIDVTVDDLTITGDIIYDKDPPFDDGVAYIEDNKITSITNGLDDQVLTIEAGVPVWKAIDDVPIDQPDGLAYINTNEIESIPNGTEDQILQITAGVPAWVDVADQDIPVIEGTTTFIGSVDSQPIFSCGYRLIKVGRLVTLYLFGPATPINPMAAGQFPVSDLVLPVGYRPDTYFSMYGSLVPDNETQFSTPFHKFNYFVDNNSLRFRNSTDAGGIWTNQRTFQIFGFSVSWIVSS